MRDPQPQEVKRVSPQEIRALRKPEAAGGWDSEPTCYAPLNRAGSGGEMLRLSEQFTNAPEECNNGSFSLITVERCVQNLPCR